MISLTIVSKADPRKSEDILVGSHVVDTMQREKKQRTDSLASSI